MNHFISTTFLGLFLISCAEKDGSKENTKPLVALNSVGLTEAQVKSAGIKLGKVEQRTIAQRLTLNGKIDVPPQNLVSVSVPMGGFLKTTHLLPGMHVKSGEVLATMEDQQYIQLQQEYLMAKSRMYYLDNEYKRQKDLNQSQSNSDKVFQQTEMEYTNAKVTLKSLSEKLKLLNIRTEALSEENLSRTINLYSPIEGFVSKVNVNIGKYVNPSEVLFELINPSDIHLNLKVFEKDIEHLMIGQKVVAFNNHQPNKKFICEIILISQNLNVDRSAEVHCHFNEYHKSLFPGMYMNAEVEIVNQNVNAVPEKAIVNYEGRDFVFVLKGKNQFELLEIKKGVSEGAYIAIEAIDGIKLNNLSLVVDGAYSLLMQLKNRTEEE